MSEKPCSTGISYKCYGPGITEKNEQMDARVSRPVNNLSQIYRVKEYGVPASTFIHPTLVRSPPTFVEPLSVKLPNEFVNNLYIKYPFLIPKGIPPKEYTIVGQKSYTSEYSDLTSYQEAYGNKGQPEPPELIEAKGLALPEPDKPPVRLPGVPYIPLYRRPLPATDAVDVKSRREEKKIAQKILRKLPPIPKRITEYQDNINILVKYWQKNGLYTDPCFFIPHKSTLPRE